MQSTSTSDGTRLCTKCKRVQPLDRFGIGKYRECKDCANWRAKKFRQANPDKIRMNNERSKCAMYGITVEQYDAMWDQQGGVCAACGNPETRTMNGKIRALAIDHDHDCCPDPNEKACGECVRGLLCHRCNISAGQFGDDPNEIMKLVMYLLRFQENPNIKIEATEAIHFDY